MVALLSLATAVPRHRFAQADAKRAAQGLFADGLAETGRLIGLFDNAGIAWRHSCVPLASHLAPSGFAERNRLGIEHGTTLLEEAAGGALAAAGIPPARVDAVVAVCSTVIATPPLDALVAERLGLRADVERTPLFGLGCGGGVLGLARAAALARARPGSVVLLLVVELCTLTLRHADRSKANLVACALFADGAAAAVIGADGPVGIGPTGEHRWPGTEDVMGWRVEDDGLGVLFSVRVPEIARDRVGPAADTFLARHGLARGDVGRWICHPGGAKVVSGLETALALAPGDLADARAVLHDYGNMSAASVFFVLERALAEPGWRRGLMLGLGPGFSAGFALLERPA
jgi:alkylresorcinol/alkylpyrone synthase